MAPSGAGSPVRGASPARIAAIAALALAVVAVALVLLSGGSSGYRYTLVFDNGGQLVPGNEVMVGGIPIGKVDSVELTEDSQAEMQITVDEPLTRGTSAVIRATSLSGVANRYVSLTLGPNDQGELPDGSTISQVDTTSPVDIDQLFNTFNEEGRKGLQEFIQGSAEVYAGDSQKKNTAYKYFSPSLVAADNLFRELASDERALTAFLVNGDAATSAIASRSEDLADAISNSNEALGAIAARNRSLDLGLRDLPPALQQANTTFVNLRATLDQLDPFITALGENDDDLAPFLRRLERTSARGVPVFSDLRLAVDRDGPANDIADFTAGLVDLKSAATTSIPATVNGMQCSAIDQNTPRSAGDVDCELEGATGAGRPAPFFAFARPYMPDFMALLSAATQVAGYYDANGHFVRVSPVTLNFDFDGTTLATQAPGGSYTGGDLLNQVFSRCPGGSTQAIVGSNPFDDAGRLAPYCDASQRPPG